MYVPKEQFFKLVERRLCDYCIALTNIHQAVRNQIVEAQKIASGSGSEQDIAEAKIELEVRLHLS